MTKSYVGVPTPEGWRPLQLGILDPLLTQAVAFFVLRAGHKLSELSENCIIDKSTGPD